MLILVVVNCRVAVGEGPDDFLRAPCCFPRDFERDSEDGGIFVLRAYAGEMFRCKANVNVMAKMFGDEVICFHLIYDIYCLV